MASTITPTFSASETGIPDLPGPFIFTGKPIILTSIIGPLIASFLRGKSVSATLTVTVSGDTVTEQVALTDDVPFLPETLAEFTESQMVTAAEGAVITAIIPAGAKMVGTVALS